MNAQTFEDAAARVGVLWPSPQASATIDTDALECWSVTSILASLNRFGLNLWLQQQVARTAWHKRDALAHLTEDEAVSLLTRQSNWVRPDYELSDRDLGSEVHRALENQVLDNAAAGTYHDEAKPMVRQFENWVREYAPKFLAAEMTVYDPQYLYAGTLDAIVELSDGRRYLVDYKTTRNDRDKAGRVRSPYAEWSLQLAAYRSAPLALPVRAEVTEADSVSPRRYYISAENQASAVPMPTVDGCLIVQLTPNAWRVWPVRIEDDARDAFLYVREAARFVEVIARRSVFGASVEGAA